MRWLHRKLNSLFSRTFMGMLVISLAVLTAVAALFLTYFRREMLDRYDQLTYTTLGNIDASFTQIITDSKRTLVEWSDSADGTCFRVAEEVDPIDHMSFVNRLHDRLIRGSYLHSIYFINKNEKVSLFLCSNLSQTEPLDELLIHKLQEQENRNQPFVWTAAKRYAQGEEVPLLTIPIADVLPGEEGFKGIGILNLSLEHLRSTLLADRQDENVQIILLDTQGNVVIHSDKTQIGKNWNEKEWVRKVLSGNTQFEVRDDGAKWKFCVQSSETPGFYIAAQSKYGTQTLNINYIIYMTLVISILAGGVIGGMMLVVSRRIFAPFTNMVGKLKDSGMGEELPKEVDEVTFLEHFYQGMSSKLEMLNDKKEKDFIIKNLLLGSHKDAIVQMMKQKGIIAEGQPYYMLLVSVQNKNGTKPYNMQEYDISRNMISTVFLSGLEEYGHTTYFEVGLRRMLFVISGEGDAVLEDSRMFDIVNGLNAAIQKVAQICTYGVLSGKLQETECAQAFERLSAHLKTRQILEKEAFLLLSALQEEPEQAHAEKLAGYLKEKNKEAYQKTAEEILDCYSTLPYEQFAENIEKIIMDMMKSGKVYRSAQQQEGESRTVKERLLAITDREELLLWMEAVYEAAAVQVNRSSTNATAALMENAIDYIRSNYDDCNLNVNMLADRVGISAAYFGKLFTEFTGTRTLDYILKIRMEQARDLLLAEPEKDIAQIALNVGC